MKKINKSKPKQVFMHQHCGKDGTPFGKKHDHSLKHKNKKTQEKHKFTINYVLFAAETE